MKIATKPRKTAALVAFVLIAGLVAPLLHAGSAMAHPLGNFTINRYARVELYRGEAVVHYVLDFAEIPALQLILDADRDGDGFLSDAETATFLPDYAEDLLGNIALSEPDAPAALSIAGSTLQVSEGQGGLDVVRIALVLTAPINAGAGEFAFEDRNFADRVGWKEVVIAPSAGSSATVGGEYLDDASDALRAYPEDALAATPDESRATFTWDPATGAAAPAAFVVEQGGASTGRGDRLSSLLEADRSLGIILLSLVAAFGFGALHALGPGHGKSVVAAYLVGSKGTPKHALALGVTVTATHTAAVYGLGFITLVASDLIAPERLFVYLGVVSGLMIVVMGVALLAGRLRSLRTRRADSALHRHGNFGREHSHLPGHVHAHTADDGHGHAHPHAAPVAATKVTWRGLLTLGIAGGLIPCPSALVVMLAAISLGQVLFGMLLIVAFSFGLAGVLVAIGLALVLGRRLSSRSGAMQTLRRPVFARVLAAVPVLSAVGVTLAGVAITYQAWNQPGL
jgi:nickel/cobalt exporter